jgi:hypothetical protein
MSTPVISKQRKKSQYPSLGSFRVSRAINNGHLRDLSVNTLKLFLVVSFRMFSERQVQVVLNSKLISQLIGLNPDEILAAAGELSGFNILDFTVIRNLLYSFQALQLDGSLPTFYMAPCRAWHQGQPAEPDPPSIRRIVCSTVL